MTEIRARDVPSSDRDAVPVAEQERPGSPATAVDGEEGADGSTGARRFVGSTPFLILVALGVAIVIKTLLVQAFYIPSESMVPTLEVGDRVFVNKLAYDVGDIARGDVIVFENPHPEQVPDRGIVSGLLHWLGEGIGVAQPANEDFVKRVVGLPGESVEIRDDVVYVDGQALAEPYLTETARRSNGDNFHFEVPAESLFVMGDNRGSSADSRYGLGFVPLDKVIGKAFVVIWPPSHVGGVG